MKIYSFLCKQKLFQALIRETMLRFESWDKSEGVTTAVSSEHSKNCRRFENHQYRGTDNILGVWITGSWTKQILASHFHESNRLDFLTQSCSPSSDWLGNRKRDRKSFTFCVFLGFFKLRRYRRLSGLEGLWHVAVDRARHSPPWQMLERCFEKSLLLWIWSVLPFRFQQQKFSSSSHSRNTSGFGKFLCFGQSVFVSLTPRNRVL